MNGRYLAQTDAGDHPEVCRDAINGSGGVSAGWLVEGCASAARVQGQETGHRVRTTEANRATNRDTEVWRR